MRNEHRDRRGQLRRVRHRVAIENATPQCQNKVCKVKTCTAPFADCAGTGTSCQTNTSTNTTNCGGCGKRPRLQRGLRPAPGVRQVRRRRVSARKCNANFADCNSNPDTDGCEANLQSSGNHCGMCGNACQAPHGTNTCAMGVCMPGCGTSFGNCDGNASTGCEAVFANDGNNCGACGTVAKPTMPPILARRACAARSVARRTSRAATAIRTTAAKPILVRASRIAALAAPRAPTTRPAATSA